MQNFIDALRQSFLASPANGAARGFADRVLSAADVAAEASAPSPTRLPVCRHLEPALRNARAHGGPAANLSGALARVGPGLAWRPRPPGSEDEEGLRDNHANAVVIGDGGREIRDDICIGISLLAPGTRYPDHRHPPEEIYSVLSPGEWRQDRGAWHGPGIGGVVRNPPDIVHAMRATDVPLLAVWCLWVEQDP